MESLTKLKILAVIGLALTVINCSKSGGGDSGSTSSPQCSAGQLWTAAGCLPTCGNGQVVWNGQCVASAAVTGTGIGGIGGIGGGTIGQSCGSNMLQSQYGCLPMCGPSSVMYNGQCLPVSSMTIPGTQPIPSGSQGGLCEGGCGAGQVRTYQGCLPRFSCDPCYGYANGWCVIGVNAHQFYGF